MNKSTDSELSLSPSTSCSSSSYQQLVSNDETILMTKKSLCPVCGDISFNRHFGVNSCNACAAFFRRSVAHQRRYICVRGKQCKLSFGNPRHMCRYCRFQRCILAGMEISAIFVQSNDEFRSFALDSPLRKILLAQRATFVNRYSAQLKAYGNDHTVLQLGVENPTFSQTTATIASEFSVLLEYLLTTGFATDLGLSMQEIVTLAKANFYNWLCYQAIVNTLSHNFTYRNSGHKRKMGFFVDESHIQLDDKSIEAYVKTMPGLLDYESAIKSTKQFFSTALHTANQIHAARMQEPEWATMFQVMSLKTAIKLFPKHAASCQETINELFSHLQRFYKKQFEDYATRMGNLVLMMEMIEKCSRVFTEVSNIFYINGYNRFLTGGS
ncbi:Nuclear receptor domain-containing protein [Aphelenchoides bicaudatus]|nr:Nuclear receptor domain-containing protein [Aphelenchoides bicaudatus]